MTKDLIPFCECAGRHVYIESDFEQKILVCVGGLAIKTYLLTLKEKNNTTTKQLLGKLETFFI